MSVFAKIIINTCLREEIRGNSTNLKELENLHNKYLNRQEVCII